jgi:ribonuclease D
VAAVLAGLGARPWQIQLTTPLLTKALAARPAAGT